FLYIHPSDSNIIYTKFWRTNNSGLSWTPFTIPLGGNMNLAIDPKNAGRIWAVGINSNVNYNPYNYRMIVYYSSDTGNTWNEINTLGLPTPLGYPSRTNLDYVNNGHDGLLLTFGPYVYYTDDRLSCWQPF